MLRALVAALLLLVAPVPAYADAIIVMIAATPTGDGVLTVPVGGDAAFAVAAINVGSTVVGSFNIGVLEQPSQSPSVGLTFGLCETNPSTGACLDEDFRGRFASGEIRTFSVFVHANKPIAFDPSTARIVFDFVTVKPHFPQPVVSGATYASTSVAVRTAP